MDPDADPCFSIWVTRSTFVPMDSTAGILCFFLISKTSVLQENEEKEFVFFGLDEYQSSDSGCELQGYFRKSQSANTLSKRKQLVGKYERSSNAQ